MSRILRARLPNGIVVSVDPFLESSGTSITTLAADAERLAMLLHNNSTSESELLTFLVNAASTIFIEAAPAQRPSVVLGGDELGADLVFALEKTEGVGIVQVRATASDANRAIDQQSLNLLSRPLLGRPIEFMYVIAGRDPNSNKHAMQIRRQLGAVPMYVLSWDEVVNRLAGPEDNATESHFEIVLVEIVNISRRLLLALASDPNLLSGIDDRQFEGLVATLLFALGLEDVELTPARKDGGRDIIMSHINSKTGCREVFVMECKHWVSGEKVTMRWAIDLLNVARRDEAVGAVLLSSSGFGPRLLDQEATLAVQGLFLKGPQTLSNWISVWQRQYGSILLEPVDPRKVLDLQL